MGRDGTLPDDPREVPGQRLRFPHDLPVDPDLDPDDPDQLALAGHPVVGRPRPEIRRRLRADVLAAIAAGGALGAPARYEMTRLIHVAKGGFPWATLWTNVSGSLVLGFVLVLVIERFPPSRYLRPFFATGFLGAYTTFSTFMVDTATLAKDGHVEVAGTYLVASLAAGLVAVWTGMMAGKLLPARHHHQERAR